MQSKKLTNGVIFSMQRDKPGFYGRRSTVQFVEITHQNLYQAAEIHAISWRESHIDFCSAEFVAKHTTERQMGYLQKEIDKGKQLYMLIDDKPVGIVSVIGKMIENLYVLPDEQRKGYGSQLLKFAIDHCQGVPTLWVLSNNVRAYCFYKKNGFKETGDRKQLREGLFEMEMKLL